VPGVAPPAGEPATRRNRPLVENHPHSGHKSTNARRPTPHAGRAPVPLRR
jgi:hypothetical protein